MNCYTLALISNPPESLVTRFKKPVTLAAWYRYGSYCPSTVPAFIVTYGALPEFNVDTSSTQIIVIDPESEIPAAMQALIAIGPYLFDQAADKPIVVDQGIGNTLYQSPIFRLIDANYEDNKEGKQQLQDDYLEAVDITLDLRQAMEILKEEVWSTVKNTLIAKA